CRRWFAFNMRWSLMPWMRCLDSSRVGDCSAAELEVATLPEGRNVTSQRADGPVTAPWPRWIRYDLSGHRLPNGIVGALSVEEVDVAALVIADDSWPISFASTTEEMPRSIIRDANACRIEWKETPSSPASFAATVKPLPVAPRWPS